MFVAAAARGQEGERCRMCVCVGGSCVACRPALECSLRHLVSAPTGTTAPAHAVLQLEGEKTRGLLAVETAVREVKELAAEEARQLRSELAHAQRDNGKHVVQIRQMERQLAAGAWVGAASALRRAAGASIASVGGLPPHPLAVILQHVASNACMLHTGCGGLWRQALDGEGAASRRQAHARRHAEPGHTGGPLLMTRPIFEQPSSGARRKTAYNCSCLRSACLKRRKCFGTW